MANETAVRVIQFYFNRLGKTKKKHIISRVDSYHGSTYLTMSLTGILFDHIGFDVIKDFIHHIPAPNTYRRPAGMSEEEFCEEKVADLENKILELGLYVPEPELLSTCLGRLFLPWPSFINITSFFYA